MGIERDRILAIKDLWNRTWELLTLVREPYPEEREVLERRLGCVVLPTTVTSLGRFVSRDQEYFILKQMNLLNNSLNLRDYKPDVPIAVGINPDPEHICLPGSFNQSQERQLEMIEEHSQTVVEPYLPNAKAVMVPATILAQADWVYYHRPETAGRVLIRNYWARALDRRLYWAAGVGRTGPSFRLNVDEWSIGVGKGRAHRPAIPAVVFLDDR